MEPSLSELLADVEAMVNCESPSADREAVERSADLVARIGERRLGVAPERIDGIHLRWCLGPGPARILVLGHHDTVWPLGTLARRPFSIVDGVLRGPGCFDMKTGLAMAFHALAGVSGVTLLVTGDEEIGSVSSRSLIEEAAAGCRAALVLEASAPGGTLKTARKGTSNYVLRAHGRAAHAGLEPENGINATIELASQTLAVAALSDPARGTTVTPTVVSAGTVANAVPARADLTLDVRVADNSEQDRVDAALRALEPVLPGAALEVLGGPNRPPMPPEASAELFRRATVVAARLGLEPPRGAAVGGASDGNFTAGVGVPTLDGLGAVGGGAHAETEHVIIAEIPARTRLLAGLVADLTGDSDPAPGQPSRVLPISGL